MFLRKVCVERITTAGAIELCPVAQIDNFCMRNFTNNAVFDDTLPVKDGLLEIGNLVSIHDLQENMQAWFRRKGYLSVSESLRITELPSRTSE